MVLNFERYVALVRENFDIYSDKEIRIFEFAINVS